MGSIQAAVTKKTHIYFCPCGLIEMAIPIVVEGNYVATLGGQFRCEDAPETVRQIEPTVGRKHQTAAGEIKAEI